jgi:type I restriction enzyme S subunit
MVESLHAGWEKIRLHQVAEKVTVGHVGPMKDEYISDGIPFLRSQDVEPFRLNMDSIKFISEVFHKKLNKSSLHPGDVVVVRTGYPGTACVIPTSLPVANCADLVIVKPSGRLNSFFLACLFNSTWGRKSVSGSLVGVAQQHFNVTVAKEMIIPLPPRKVQDRIATILSAYDDLIETNLRRIKILEEMAQTLYREWFVKFCFPGHQKVKMMDSGLGLIPEGWEAATLDDVLATIESGSRPKGGIDPEARGVPSIGAENIIGLGRYDYSKEKFVTRDFFDNMNRGHIQSGDVLLYKDGAQIGRKSMFRDGFPHAECCINEHVFIMRTNGRCSQNYLFFWLDQPEMTQNIINLNANAAQPGINQSGVRGLPILLPPAPLLKDAEQVLEPMLGALFNNAKRNNILRQTRDLLLPKLISGELDVSELDITIPEAKA